MEMAKRKPEVVAGTTGSGIRAAEALAAETRDAKARDHKGRPTRRKFTPEYKLRMVKEADAALASGEVGATGALLRREGLYSSHLVNWRKERDAGVLEAFSKKRGPKAVHNPLTEEVARLERENAKLEDRLRRAEIVIDVQKKVALLLGTPLPESSESS
jgi:transposase-like protein